MQMYQVQVEIIITLVQANYEPIFKNSSTDGAGAHNMNTTTMLKKNEEKRTSWSHCGSHEWMFWVRQLGKVAGEDPGSLPRPDWTTAQSTCTGQGESPADQPHHAPSPVQGFWETGRSGGTKHEHEYTEQYETAVFLCAYCMLCIKVGNWILFNIAYWQPMIKLILENLSANRGWRSGKISASQSEGPSFNPQPCWGLKFCVIFFPATVKFTELSILSRSVKLVPAYMDCIKRLPEVPIYAFSLLGVNWSL